MTPAERLRDLMATSSGWPLLFQRSELQAVLDRVAELEAALRDYEAWEAKVILDDAVWRRPDSLPTITQELWDEFVEIQGRRNTALKAAP